MKLFRHWMGLAGLLLLPVLSSRAQAPELAVDLLNGSVRLQWTNNPPGYRLESRAALSPTDDWQPVVMATLSGADNRNTVTLPPSGLDRFFRLGATPLTTIAESSPVNGEIGVSVVRETILRFSTPLATNTLFSADNFFAGYQGRRLLSRIELGSDRRTATLFYLEPLPAGSQVTAVFDSTGLTDEMGRALDPDGDGHPGGMATVTFQTFGSTPLDGTAVIGHVYASELMPGSDDSTTTNRPLAGVTITVDGQEQTLRTVTDANGYFSLNPCPAGRFFVKIDGRTAAGSQYPSGAYYPFVGKPWEAIAGETNNLAGGTGEIFLPKIAKGTLTQVSALTNTVVTFAPAVLASNPVLAGVSVTIPANSLYSNDGTRGGKVGIAPVSPDRLPAPLPVGVDPALVITIQTDGPNNFDRPAPMRFPNLPSRSTGRLLPPGGKSALWSFNHKTGHWEIQGAMTVSADGKFLDTDPGVGVRQPGWEFPEPGTGGSGGGGGDGGGGGGGGGGGDDPCKTERHLAESAAVQCALSTAVTVATTLAKSVPLVGCAIGVAQGIAASVADCNINPDGCKVTIAGNAISSIIGCIPVVGDKLTILLNNTANGGGLVKGCLIDLGGAYGAYSNCKKANGLNRIPPRGRALPASPGVPSETLTLQLHLLEAAADLYAYTFGDPQWSAIEPADVPAGFDLLSALAAAMQPGSDGDEHITPAEAATIMALPRPANISAQSVAQLITRFEQITSHTLPEGEFDLAHINQAALTLLQYATEAEALGWKTAYDGLFQVLTGLSTDEGDVQAKLPLTHKPLAYRLTNLNAGGVPQYGHLNLLGQFDNLPLEANAYYQLDYFDRETFFVGHTVFQSADNGQITTIPVAAMNPANPKDSDNDGLPDEVEIILGTDPQKADTDGDGVSDGAEVAANTDPMDGLVGLPRVIGLAPTGGSLQVAVRGNYALMAESESGLGIFNISEPQPSLVAQLNLARVVSVAFAGEFGLATVGRTGLAIYDLANPVQPVLVRIIGLPTSSEFVKVAVAGNLAYVISENAIYLVDWAAGVLLDRRELDPDMEGDTPQDLVISGDSVYLLTGHLFASSGRNYLHRFNVGRMLRDDTASLLLAGSSYAAYTQTHLALAPGYVYITGLDATTPFSSGLTIISDTPAGLQLAAPQVPLSVASAAATGSGAVLAGAANLDLLDARDPNHVTLVSAFALPQRPKNIALNQGQAYVAYGLPDSDGGLAVVNYLAPDTLGQPPTISLTASFSLAPAIVEPDRPVVVTALAVDDVQVRNVEFYLDGVLVENVGAYPFDFRFTTPATTNQTSFKLRARAYDTGGNVSSTDEITVLVRVGATPPTVTNTLPPANSVALPGLVTLQAGLSKPLNPASVTTSSVQLRSAGADGIQGTADDQAVDGFASYDPGTRTLQFTPSMALPAGDYRATVDTGVTDLDGVHLAAPFIWNFTLRTAVTWNINAAGDWLVANNWTNQTLPQAGDFVLVDRTNGTYTVSYNGGSLSLDSLFSREPVVIGGGKFSLARNSRIENSLTLGAGTLSVASELEVTGGLNWQNGVLDGGGTTMADGELTITGGPSRLLRHTLVSRAHVTWNAPNNTGIIVDDPAAVIRNAESGVWEAYDRQIMVYTGFQGAPRFDNDGLFRAFGNDGGINFTGVAFNNRGTASVETGSLKLNGGGNSAGAFEIAAPGTLEFGGDHLLGPTSTIHGAGNARFRAGTIIVNGSYDVAGITQFGGIPVGPVSVNFNGPIHNLGSQLLLGNSTRATFLSPDLNVTNDITVDGGILEFSQGNGSLAAPRSLTITNFGFLVGFGDVEVRENLVLQAAYLGGPGRLTSQGNSKLLGGQFFTTVAGGKQFARPFDNAGTAALGGDVTIATLLRNLPGATFDIQGDYSVVEGSTTGPSAFVNAGTLLKSQGTGSSRVSVALRNTGLIEVLTGKLQVGDFTQTAGEIRLAGLAITGFGKFDLQGGFLTGTGNLEIYPFRNLGAVVSPGLAEAPIGTLHLIGMYTQGAAATLALDLAGTTPGTGFDQVNIDYQASLDGTLLVNILPGYQPAVGDTFRVLTTSQRTGKFSTITTTGLPAGLKLTTSYDTTGVTLTIVAGP